MNTYSKNLEKLVNIFTKKIGWSISIKSSAIEVLEKFPESKTNLINKVTIDNGLINAKIEFKK